MDWQKNRIWIGLVALLVVGGGAFWALRSNTGDTPVTTSSTIEGFPSDIERDAVTSFEITQPGEPSVRLERRDGTWRVAAPVDAPADQTSVDTALDKITELALETVAARTSAHHGELEVDAEHGIHVVVRGGEQTLADFWVGVARSGNTAVRLEGQDAVGMVNGSIRFAFARELKDWRNRTMLDIESDDVRDVSWTTPTSVLHFARTMTTPAAVEDGGVAEPTLGDWAPVEVSFTPAAEPSDGGVAAAPTPVTSIPNFQASKVRTMITALAHLRAADFAPADMTADAAGIASGARVTLTLGEGTSATSHSVRLGAEAGSDQFYAMVDDDPTVYLVSRYHSGRIRPQPSDFEASAAGAEPEAPEGGGGGPDIQIGGPGGQQIPPEIMQQIQQQLQQQGLGGGGH